MPSPSQPTRFALERAGGIALLLGGLALVLATFRDYGITWDETVQAMYGERVLDYFLSGFRDTRCNDLVDLRFYGPVFDLLAAAIYRSWPEARFETRHLLNALTGLLAVVAVYRYGLRLGSARIGLLAAVAMATMPRFYGDSFHNPKDVPFACAFSWALVALADLLTTRSWGLGRIVSCGAAFGLAAAVRPGGWPLLLLIAASGAAFARLAGGPSSAVAGRAGPVAAKGLVLLAVAWVGMVSLWPWAHGRPFTRPVLAMVEAASFSQAYEVLYDGERIPSDRLPRTYPLEFLLISTPLPVLGLAAVGIATALRRLRAAARDPRSVPLFLAVTWLALPLAVFLALRPNVYDGIRHFLFLLPALALVAAVGADGLLSWARGVGLGRPVAVLVWVLLLAPVPALVRLHPYQTTYFNALVGGLSGAAGRYETDYWASSYKEAAEWINADRDPEHRSVRTVVLVASNPYSLTCAAHYLDPAIDARRLTVTGAKGALPAGVDYYIGTTRFGADRNFPESPVVHTVGREGAVFTVIRGRSRDR